MDLSIQFIFRKKLFSCTVLIDKSEYPCYIFVLFEDNDLIKEFGDEITIKTDCDRLLAKKDDYPELVELRQSIFNVVKIIPEFIAIKSEMMQKPFKVNTISKGKLPK